MRGLKIVLTIFVCAFVLVAMLGAWVFLSTETSYTRNEAPPAATSPDPVPPTEPNIPPPVPTSDTLLGQSGYIYKQLTAEQQTLYIRLYLALQAMESPVIVTAAEEESLGERSIFDIFYYVICEHPEFYWVENFINSEATSINGRKQQVSVSLNYNMSEKERTAAQQKVDAWAAASLVGLSPSANDFAKILHVYNYLISETDYAADAAHNQDIYSVAAYGESVCMGYARATQYLLLSLDIPTTTVVGNAEGQGAHAWNLVYADGKYYYLDTTWGDPELPGGGGSGYASYDYFLVTEKDLASTHKADVTYPLPACVSDDLNYYSYRQRRFAHYDRDTIIHYMKEDLDAGLPQAGVRFTGRSEFDRAVEDLFHNNGIAGLIQTAGTISYYLKEDLGIITVLP
jgi:hypothetical protein